MRRPSCRDLAFTLLVAFSSSMAWPATPDEIFRPVISTKDILSATSAHYFEMSEKGAHGSASFDGFSAEPGYWRLGEEVRFAPLKTLDVNLGYDRGPATSYDRPTKNNAGVVTSMQRYDIKFLQDFQAGARWRLADAELSYQGLYKRDSTSWDFATSVTATPNFFNYFHNTYSDHRLRYDFLFPATAEGGAGAGLASIDGPLLSSGQGRLAAEARLRQGVLRRQGAFYVADKQDRRYFFHTDPHWTPALDWRYGLSSSAEIAAGIKYTTPLTYAFDYEQYKASGPSDLIHGRYRFRDQYTLSLGAKYRPSAMWSADLASDIDLARQELEHWEKKEDGSTVRYPTRKLVSVSAVPTFTLSYLQPGPEGNIPADELDRLTDRPRMTVGGNLWRLRVRRDITYLDKGAAGGTINRADPYHVYLYPMENFVSGTEYAAFFSGNSSASPAQVGRQNFYQFELGLDRGVTSGITAGMRLGYCTQSAAHQFSVQDKADRYFRWKPYYYIDGDLSWRAGKAQLISAAVHFVPQYKTVMTSSVHPEDFRDSVRYVGVGLKYQVLF